MTCPARCRRLREIYWRTSTIDPSGLWNSRPMAVSAFSEVLAPVVADRGDEEVRASRLPARVPLVEIGADEVRRACRRSVGSEDLEVVRRRRVRVIWRWPTVAGIAADNPWCTRAACSTRVHQLAGVRPFAVAVPAAPSDAAKATTRATYLRFLIGTTSLFVGPVWALRSRGVRNDCTDVQRDSADFYDPGGSGPAEERCPIPRLPGGAREASVASMENPLPSTIVQDRRRSPGPRSGLSRPRLCRGAVQGTTTGSRRRNDDRVSTAACGSRSPIGLPDRQPDSLRHGAKRRPAGAAAIRRAR